MAKERKAPKKINSEEYLIVSANADWLNTYIGKGFYDNDFYRIIEFYVLHSPCKVSSYTPISFEKLGWKNPWNSSRFRHEFDIVPNFRKDENYRYHESINHFKGMWEDANWGEFFNIEKSEFAVFIHAGESNPRMDLLHHIRNSFAHGRFSVKKDSGEYYIYLEDVTTVRSVTGLVVNSRICLKKSTLISWLDTFEKKSEAGRRLESIYLESVDEEEKE